MTHRADPIRLGALGERSAWGLAIFIVKFTNKNIYLCNVYFSW